MARSITLKWKWLIFALLILGLAGLGYYRLIYEPSHRPPLEIDYVLAPTLKVEDSPAEVRLQVGLLSRGNRVEVTDRYAAWRRIRRGEIEGWARADGLMDAAAYQSGRELLHEVSALPPQAEGHTMTPLNLRVAPSRDAATFAQMAQDEPLQIFERRVIPPKAEGERGAAGLPEVWYLVRAGTNAGWLPGRLIALDIPAGISMYAEDVNLVAWLVLKTVPNNGREVPEYLAADREGTQEFDFTHFRVFTWSPKKQRYVTAYVEGNLKGYFPIRSGEADGNPTFRLRLVDAKGRKYQRVYEMFDTIVRPLGTVAGWASNALPRAEHGRGRRERRSESGS